MFDFLDVHKIFEEYDLESDNEDIYIFPDLYREMNPYQY